MPSGFPGSIDNFTDPLSNSPLNSPSHSGLHADVNDAVEKIETYMGLVRLVASTTFSAVSAVEIDSIFSTNYDVYRLFWFNTNSNTANETRAQFRTSAATNTNNNYVHQNTWFGTTSNLVRNTVATSSCLVTQNVGASGWTWEMTIYNPYNNARNTTLAVTGTVYDGTVYFAGSGAFNTTTRFDGIRISTTAGTMTGQYYVYGYRN